MIARIWEVARSGDLRGAADAAGSLLAKLGRGATPGDRVELSLVAASCLMRQGLHADAIRELDAAESSAAEARSGGEAMLNHVAIWRAELAYFQGRHSAADAIIDRLLDRLEQTKDWAYTASHCCWRAPTTKASTRSPSVPSALPKRARTTT